MDRRLPRMRLLPVLRLLWLLALAEALGAGCGSGPGAAPPASTRALTTLPPAMTVPQTSTTVLAGSRAERSLQLTRTLPAAYREACRRLMAYAPVRAAGCPPAGSSAAAPGRQPPPGAR